MQLLLGMWVFTVLTDLLRSKNFLPPPVPLNDSFHYERLGNTPFRHSTFIAKWTTHGIPQGKLSSALTVEPTSQYILLLFQITPTHHYLSLEQHALLWRLMLCTRASHIQGVRSSRPTHVVTDTPSYDWA